MTSPALDGRSVLVTGGGTGIGAACARRAAAEGATVTICGRTEASLERSAERIRAQGGRVHTVVADVTVEDDVVRVVAEAVAFGGGLHGVVANAGGGTTPAPFHLQDVAEFTRVLNLNVVGTMLCIKHSVAELARDDRGAFVGMSSIAGHVTHQHFGAYPPAKAAIESLVRNAADEYGHLGVRFNAIQPGFITTKVMEGIERGGPVWNSYIEQTPLDGVGEPDDIAAVACFLLSDESRWMTGQTLAVDGGHCLRAGPDYSAMVELIHGPGSFDPRATS